MGLSVGAVEGTGIPRAEEVTQDVEALCRVRTDGTETRTLRTKRSGRDRSRTIFELRASLLRERTTKRRNSYGQRAIDVVCSLSVLP